MEIFNLIVGYISELQTATTRDILQIIAAGVAILATGYGILQRLRYSKAKLGRVLDNHLKDQERNIAAAEPAAVVRILSREKFKPAERQDLNDSLDEAFSLLDRGKARKAEAVLLDLNDKLRSRAKLARDQAAVADRQSAAVHVFLGAIADRRGDIGVSIKEFGEAHKLNGDDLFALKYLGLAHQKVGDPDAAIGSFERMAEAAFKNNEHALHSEALRLQGSAQVDKKKRTAARTSFEASLQIASDHGLHAEVGAAAEALHEVNKSLGYKTATKEALQKSLSAFDAAGDRASAERVRDKLKELPAESEGQVGSGKGNGSARVDRLPQGKEDAPSEIQALQ